MGCELDPDEVRGYLRHAVDGVSSATVRVNVFPRTMDWLARRGAPSEADVLVTIAAPRHPSDDAPKVQSIRFERFLPQIKHTGIGLGLMRHGRRALVQGWDDVLFLDAEGRIEEGSVWNIGFFDGNRIVWPSAPALFGIAMQLVQIGLAKKGIPSETHEMRIEDLPSFRSAFLTNTIQIVQPIARIDGTAFSADPELIATLTQCHDSNAEEPV